MLRRAPRTEAELEHRLIALGYRRDTAAAAVARCRELRWVGDAAFAAERARALRTRGAGSLRIEAELAARGVPDAFVAAAVEGSREGEPEREWARRALGRLAGALGDPRVRGRAWRLLAARGFSEDVLVDLLGEG